MKLKQSKALTAWQIIEGILIIALGVLTIVFSGNDTFYKVISIITGALLIADATVRIIVKIFLAGLEKKIDALVIISALELSFGIFFCVRTDFLLVFFCFFIAILLVVGGSLFVISSLIHLIGKKGKKGNAIGEIIIGAIVLTLGILALIFANTATIAILVTVGVIIAIGGAGLIALSIIQYKNAKKIAEKKAAAKKHVKEIEEVEAVEPEVIDNKK